jgi:hypothetical protein
MSYFGDQKVLPLRHHEAASSSSGRPGDDAGGPGMPAFDQLLAKTKEKAATGLLVTADQVGFATTLAISRIELGVSPFSAGYMSMRIA